MEKYCESQGIQMESMRFMIDGERITKAQSPADVIYFKFSLFFL